jgi:hypothetical protein
MASTQSRVTEWPKRDASSRLIAVQQLYDEQKFPAKDLLPWIGDHHFVADEHKEEVVKQARERQKVRQIERDTHRDREGEDRPRESETERARGTEERCFLSLARGGYMAKRLVRLY